MTIGRQSLSLSHYPIPYASTNSLISKKIKPSVKLRLFFGPNNLNIWAVIWILSQWDHHYIPSFSSTFNVQMMNKIGFIWLQLLYILSSSVHENNTMHLKKNYEYDVREADACTRRRDGTGDRLMCIAVYVCRNLQLVSFSCEWRPVFIASLSLSFVYSRSQGCAYRLR